MNIPIYRAKRTQCDEYVVGYYTEKVKQYPGRHYIHFNNGCTETYERIDPTTLAIHFSGMLDSQGDKFFASLSKNGIGGDEFITENEDGQYDIWKSTDYGTTTAIFNSSGISFTSWRIEEDEDDSIYSREHTKVIGVQE